MKEYIIKGRCFNMGCIVIVIVMFLNVILCSTVQVYAEDKSDDKYDMVRKKYFNYLTGGLEYDINDPIIAKKISEIDKNAEHNWKSMNSEKVWDDLMKSSSKNINKTSIMFNRVYSMAKAYATYGSSYYQDVNILNDIKQSLEWLYNNRYNENTDSKGNWWNYVIGIPTKMLKTITLIYDYLTPEQITNYCAAVNKFCPGPIRPGANGADESLVTVLKGVLTKNSSEIKKGCNGINETLDYVTNGDGMYEDGTFIFHRKIPYNLHYGIPLLDSNAKVLWLLNGSEWENTYHNRINIYEWVTNAYLPFMLDGKLALSLTGRFSADNSNNVAFGGEYIKLLCAISILSEMEDNPYSTKFKSKIQEDIIKAGTDSFYKVMSISQYLMIKDIFSEREKNTTACSVADGNYHLYNGDIMAHKRPGWFFINKMHSSRIFSYEVTNKMDRKAWYKSDGATYIYTNPKDYLNNWIWAVDYHRIPGTTVDRWIERPDAQGGACWGTQGPESDKDFVGGVSLGKEYGISVMDFKQHHGNAVPEMDVEAKKSWFMFDNEVVALGAGINSTSGRSIETIIDNRILNNNEIFKVNGDTKPSNLGWSEKINNANWAFLEKFGGFYFPKGSNLNVLRERRAENINNISTGSQTDMFDTSVLSNDWSWIRENGEKHLYQNGKLTITTENGTLKDSVNSTKNILLKRVNNKNYDYEFSTHLEDFMPCKLRQEAGLILYVDDDNYMYISRAFTKQGKKIVVAKEENGKYEETLVDEYYGSDVYFKIDKTDDKYSFYVSNCVLGDDINWGEKIKTLTLSSNKSLEKSMMIGVFAQNGDNDTKEIQASFDYIKIKNAGKFLTMWIDHGINPVNDTYEYVLLPTMTSNKVSNYAKRPDITVLENNEEIQAVKENKLNVTGIITWNSLGGIINKYKANSNSCMLIKENKRSYNIAVSDPSQLQSTLLFEINDCGSGVISCDKGVKVTQLRPTIKFSVDTKDSHGKSFELEIMKADK